METDQPQNVIASNSWTLAVREVFFLPRSRFSSQEDRDLNCSQTDRNDPYQHPLFAQLSLMARQPLREIVDVLRTFLRKREREKWRKKREEEQDGKEGKEKEKGYRIAVLKDIAICVFWEEQGLKLTCHSMRLVFCEQLRNFSICAFFLSFFCFLYLKLII